jgi:hypothetical protein
MSNERRLTSLKAYYAKLMKRVVHWKEVLATWQLGTRDANNGTYQALQDLHENLIRKQVQLDAVTEILVCRGIFSPEDLLEKQIELAVRLDQNMETKFPGVKTTDSGLDVDPEVYQKTKNRLNFPL